MSKEIKFFITDFRGFYDIINKPIRSKEDIIRVLLLSIKNLLLENEFEDEGKGEVKIIIGKNSRIYFICKERGNLPNKYYSFTFPFFVEKDIDGKVLVKSKINSEVITSELVDNLLVLLENKWFSDLNETFDDIDKFACDYFYIFEEYYSSKGIIGEEQDRSHIEYWSIVKSLLTFEPAYVRYDYDPDHEDGEKHPLNHLDIHYANNGTFKLGFDKSMKIKDRLEFNIFKYILENGKEREEICYKIK